MGHMISGLLIAAGVVAAFLIGEWYGKRRGMAIATSDLQSASVLLVKAKEAVAESGENVRKVRRYLEEHPA